MSKTYLVSIDTLKTFCQGALGAMTFGAYHQYTTNKIMELNNEKIEIQHKTEMKEMEKQQKILNEKLENLQILVSQNKKWW